jgi:hypothetical protein
MPDEFDGMFLLEPYDLGAVIYTNKHGGSTHNLNYAVWTNLQVTL